MKVLRDPLRQHGRAIPDNVDPQLLDIFYIKRSYVLWTKCTIICLIEMDSAKEMSD